MFALLASVSLWVGSHPNPPNLQDVDCAMYHLAVEYGASKFSGDTPAVTTALADALLAPAGCKQNVTTASYHRLGGYAKGYDKPMGSTDVGAKLLFVDTKGSDSSGDGSIAKPFATLARAQSEVRKTPVASRPKTTVNIRAGTYYLSSTFELSTEDSGFSADAPVTYTAYNGENVTISGGQKLDLDWQPYSGTASASITAGTAFMAKLPPGVPSNFTTLFADNKRQIRARYPNGNPEDKTGMCFSKTQYPNAGEGCHGYLGGLKQISAVPLPADIQFKATMPGRNHARTHH